MFRVVRHIAIHDDKELYVTSRNSVVKAENVHWVVEFLLGFAHLYQCCILALAFGTFPFLTTMSLTRGWSC